MNNRLLGKFSQYFHPRLIDALRGYNKARFSTDLNAGITVGVIALPLAIAFAIASGAKPEAGIFTAIIAGFIISALGGSRVQIGGPTGAFIVIVYGIIAQYAYANPLIAIVGRKPLSHFPPSISCANRATSHHATSLARPRPNAVGSLRYCCDSQSAPDIFHRDTG